MFSLIALTIYLVLDVLRPQEVLYPESTAPIMFWAAIALLCFWLIETVATGRGWRSFPSTRFVFGLLVVAMLSSGIAYIRDGGDQWSKFQDMAKALFIYVFIVQTVGTARRLAYVRNLLVLLIVILAVAGVLFSLGVAVPGFKWERDERLQYAGIFNDSNDLGLMYVVAFAILLFGIVNTRRIGDKILFLVLLIPVGWAIYLTASRGAILGALTGVFLAFRRRFGLLLPAALACAALLAMNQYNVARMNQLAVGEESAEQRIVAWGQGWYMLRSHPLLGVGPRNFVEYHGKTAHSTVVQAAAELGMAGLFCWLGMFYYPLQEFTRWNSLRKGKSTGPPMPVQQLQAALLGCMVAGLFLSRLYINTPYLLAGLVVVAREITQDEEPEQETEIDASQRPTYTPDLSIGRIACIQLGVLMVWRIVIFRVISGI